MVVDIHGLPNVNPGKTARGKPQRFQFQFTFILVCYVIVGIVLLGARVSELENTVESARSRNKEFAGKEMEINAPEAEMESSGGGEGFRQTYEPDEMYFLHLPDGNRFNSDFRTLGNNSVRLERDIIFPLSTNMVQSCVCSA